MIMRGGTNIYNTPIGVLGLDSTMAKPPGHIKNGCTFPFPVIYKNVEGITPKLLIQKPDASMLDAFIQAAQFLEKEGAKAITGSCGFMVLYQEELADAVNIPVYISSLIQVPMVSKMLKRGQTVGIMTASKEGLTSQHLDAVGIKEESVHIAGMEGNNEFWEVIIDNLRDDIDLVKMESEIIGMAKNLVNSHPDIGAIVLECTDMPPYAHAIQKELNIPVFDLATLTSMMFTAVERTEFSSF